MATQRRRKLKPLSAAATKLLGTLATMPRGGTSYALAAQTKLSAAQVGPLLNGLCRRGHVIKRFTHAGVAWFIRRSAKVLI